MPKRSVYDPNSLEAAVKEVDDGTMSKKAAAKKYGAPRATIQFRLSDKFTKSSCGLSTILSKEEEELLEHWIIDCARKGFPGRRDDLLLSVQDCLNKTGRETIFKDSLPGKGWYKALLTRHPNLRCDLCSKTFHKNCLDNFYLEEKEKLYVCKDCLNFGDTIAKELKIK